ncbi:MAG: NAD-dependent epimerase/dehydratase family protein [Anaerolineaceae bacterium]|nr:NAD-dependent epimerase/dehydratase family protein [Anaerolineaceae bacterium]
MSRYLVTGAAGFIASRVCHMLVEQGHEVVGVDNMSDSYDVRLKEWRLSQLLPLKGFTFVRQDICDYSGFGQALEAFMPFDAIINLAARAGVRASVDNPWIFVETNIRGTLNLLEFARHHGIGKFVLASTSSLYGSRNPLPFHEDDDTDHPISPYAASKKGAESLAFSYHHLYGIDTTVFRYFTVYGPAGRPDMSPLRFAQWICEGKPVTVTGDGSQIRDFTYVDDIARGTIAGLRPLGFETINLGNDNPRPLMDMIHILEKEFNRKANIIYAPMPRADVNATQASLEKAGALLNWEPAISLEEGIAHLAAWYLAERQWASQILTP